MAASGEKNYTVAAEAAAEIVSQKLEILLSRPEGIGCLTNEALQKARENLATIQKFFSARERPLQSTEWTGLLLQALYDAEEFIDKFYFKVARGRHEALHVATRPLAVLVYKYMLWRDLSNLVKSMKEFCKNQYLKMPPDGGRKDEPASFAPWEGQKLARLTNFWDRRASTELANESSESDIKLSYHKLPVHLKPCLIYMALFPVKRPISIRRLVRLWLAEGLLDSHCCNRELKRTPEDLGETFILELADKKVIDVVSWRADGSPKACQMLTSLYDFICPTTMRTGFLYVHKASNRNDSNPTGQQQQRPDAPLEGPKVRWLAEHTNIVRDNVGHSYRDLKLGHIRSFLSFDPRKGKLTKDISTFLGNTTAKADCSLLRVLDLEGVYKPSLQGVLHKLVLLRYLGLRSTVLESIPSEVAHLHYLETLDMKHTNIGSLPSPLWQKRNLRHLHLNWFYIDLMEILKACSNNVMALTQLQTLSGLVVGEVKENLIRDHRHSLTTLTTLKLYLQRSGGDTSGAAGKAVGDWISFGLTNLQSLTFGVIQEANPVEETPPTKESPKGAQSLKGATTVENKSAKEAQPLKEKMPATSKIGPLPGLSLAQHRELLELYLLGQLKEPVIWTQLLPGSLRVLTLSGSMVETDTMAQLGDLLKHLRTFRLLANSFQGTCLRFAKDGFPSLLVLKIWKLPSLQEMTIAPGAMPHLQELDFRHLDAMKKVEGFIHQCKELKNIRVVVKKSADDFVKHLEEENPKRENQSKIEKIVMPKLTDDDDDGQ